MPGYSRGFLKMSFRGICGMGYCFNKYLKKKKKDFKKKRKKRKKWEERKRRKDERKIWKV